MWTSLGAIVLSQCHSALLPFYNENTIKYSILIIKYSIHPPGLLREYVNGNRSVFLHTVKVNTVIRSSVII